MEFTLITDAVYTALASARPAVAWGVELIRRNHIVYLTAPVVNRRIAEELKGLGFRVNAREVNEGYSLIGSILNLIKSGGGVFNGVTINFSNSIRVESTLFYFQGFLSELTRSMGTLGKLATPFFRLIDADWIKAMKRSRGIIVNSLLSLKQLESTGLKATAVIHPPIQSWLIKSLLNINEEGSYYLVYSGKETNWQVVKWFMRNKPGDWRAFGKFNPPKELNLWKFPIMPEEDLPKIYAGAKLVLFTYRHEPFGYIPVEAALAGKPTIAIGPPEQGPWEQWVLGYPILWLPEPMLKEPPIPRMEDRVKVALRHDASNSINELLKVTDAVLNNTIIKEHA